MGRVLRQILTSRRISHSFRKVLQLGPTNQRGQTKPRMRCAHDEWTNKAIGDEGELGELGRVRRSSDDNSGMSTADLQRAFGWVNDHGECLYRYALVRVRKPEVAEDLVQETFLAAVRGYETFGGRSSERSWLVGILKNKIVDHFRKVGRETSFTDMEFLSDEFSEKFVSVGFWNHDLGPHEWKPEPDEVMHRAEFWQVMREMDDVPRQRGLRDPLHQRQQSLGNAASSADGAAGMS